ncbi:hypothetical protein MNB_SM-7-1128 [hydrothermal vent metagenome]|uniref:Uncharacterized protein n=1 Tax=hydrothermal vent metagenome TaxID=652676 RepID=A0A1W1BAS2_9ZZZZ
MMADIDQYSERTTQGFGQNLGSSFMGMLFGLVLLIGSIVLIWWNESQSVSTADALKEMRDSIVKLEAPKVNPSNDGKAVWIYGELIPKNKLIDDALGISTDALVMQRVVKMYQWEESKESHTENKIGGGSQTVTTYTYQKVWSSRLIHSANFNRSAEHQNPPQMLYEAKLFATDATIGDFFISEHEIATIEPSQTLDLSSYTPPSSVKNMGTYFYIGHNPNQPQIGDIKISYIIAPKGNYSIAAKQSSNTLIPYTSSNEKMIFLIQHSIVQPDIMFKNELRSNMLQTWLLRGLGLVLMFFGFLLIMGPLTALANVIPFFGTIVGGASLFIAFMLTLLFGSFIIALSWFGARPLMSLLLFGGGASIAFGISKYKKSKSAQTTTTTPPPRKTPPPRRG